MSRRDDSKNAKTDVENKKSECFRRFQEIMNAYVHFAREVDECERYQGTPHSEMGSPACNESVINMCRFMSMGLRLAASCPDQITVETKSALLRKADYNRKVVEYNYEGVGWGTVIHNTLGAPVRGKNPITVFFETAVRTDSSDRRKFREAREQLEEAISEAKKRMFDL